MASHRRHTGPRKEDAWMDVIQDRGVREKIDKVKKYALGEHNTLRRVRDLSSVLPMYLELRPTCWPYWGLLLKVLLLALNVTAIFFAWITFKSPNEKGWQYQIPARAQVWLEFIGICYYLLRLIWATLRFLVSLVHEARSTPDTTYLCNLEVCNRLRLFYKAGVKLQWNLLMMLRYVSPPAVLAALYKARRRVYGKYGTRVHRQNCCLDLLCCCCFYGRLALCSLLWYVAVVLCAAAALLMVFLKVLQLRFLGNINITEWSITELLLFGQFVVNIATLDTRQRSRMKGKLELIFCGADAEGAVEERSAKRLFDNLAMLVVRYRHSMFTSMVLYHSLTSYDISYLYIHDDLEADKPKNHVRHTTQPKKPKASSGGGSSNDAGDHTRDQDAWGGLPPGAAHPGAGRRPGASAGGMTAPMQQYDNPEWEHYPGYGAADPASHGRTPPPHHNPLYPAQVYVEMEPAHHGGGAGGPGGYGGPGAPGPSRPPPPRGPQPPGQGAESGRFPYAFYDHGHAVGAPVHGWGPQPALKSKYEQVLWGVQAS